MANRLKGKVNRIYTNRSATNIRLELPAGTEQPKDGYFVLEIKHENYHALHALALSAAINGYALSIRAVEEITSTAPAQVEYLVVDW
jgi:hypothetical protein